MSARGPYRPTTRNPLYVRHRLEELRAAEEQRADPPPLLATVMGSIRRIFRRLDALEEALASHLAASDRD